MNTRFNKLVIAAALATGFAAALPAFAADVSPSDAALASQVKAALVQSNDFNNPETDIIVTATQGKINLSGWVNYTSDVQAAEKVVSKVSGVKAVSSNLRTWSSDERP